MLTLENVCYSYISRSQRNDVLRGVSYTFEPGTFYAIQGPSGSGKSTLLSLLALLDRPTAGEILFAGRPVSAIDPDAYRSRHVAMVFQQFNLLPFMTVLENAAYPAELLGKPQQTARGEAARLLGMVGLDAKYHRRMPRQLSGGEQQRVAIARALCSGAQVILADEPTGSLDEANSRNIAELLQSLSREHGRTVIMVTHDEEMAAYADVRLHMQAGQLRRRSAADRGQ